MKEWIPHKILHINEFIHEDPVLMEYMKLIFNWANEMGLQGKKVSGLSITKPDTFNRFFTIWCKKENE